MHRSLRRCLTAFVAVMGIFAAPAAAMHDGDTDASGMTKLFNSQNPDNAINSDLAFWGNHAFQGDYFGFRVFDVSNPASPALVTRFECYGPQNDPVVWRNLLFLAVDRTLNSPHCEDTDPAAPQGDPRALPPSEDPHGWEGVRIFDISDVENPKLIKGVYTDCGAHTITLYPKTSSRLLLYVSSYPLRGGPTCGPVRGPEAGNSPLHEKISVIGVNTNNPAAAKVVAEPKISYPTEADNKFDADEHGLTGFNDLTGCHDIGVFVELRIAGAACAEEAQLWRIKPNGLPDTQHPIWTYHDDDDTDGPGSQGTHGDVAVDFWHSATFSWDGKYVSFIDESFGSGCPPVTTIHSPEFTGTADTGRMFFLDTTNGQKLSHFMIDRPNEDVYCSAHLGNTVHTEDSYLLVNAWYAGGADVVDFNDPANPFESTFYDAGDDVTSPTDSDNWSAYWYEGPGLPEPSLTMYGTDGVEDPPSGQGFQVFSALTDIHDVPLPFLNPQTQMHTLGDPVTGIGHGTARTAKASGRTAKARSKSMRAPRSPRAADVRRHLAP